MPDLFLHHDDDASKTYRILVVESNPEDAEALEGMLRGIRTVSLKAERVDSLEAALEILEQGDMDLALLDLKLRDSQGLETLERAVAKAPRTVILALGDSDDESLYARALEAGAQDYLYKDCLHRFALMRVIVHAIKTRQNRETLFRERDLLRTVIDNLPDLIYVKDVESRYILSNLYHMKFLGASKREEVEGKTVHDFFPAELAENFYADEQAVTRSGESIITKEELTLNFRGEKMWVSTTKVPLRDPSGKITGLVGLSRDITQRVLAEEQAERYAQALAEKNAEMEADLKLANEFQQAVLPREFPRFPCNADPDETALRFFARYQPCSAISGDFFDVRALSDTKAAVFICDVMGHNVRAALVTAILDGLIEKMGPIAGDAGLFLTEINRDLAAILRRAEKLVFASAFYMVVDAATGHVQYANAGAPQPFLLDRTGRKTILLGEPDEEPMPALGLMENIQYRTGRRQMHPGDALVLFTDGLYEVANPRGEEYSLDRLAEVFRDGANGPLPELLDGALDEIRRFSHSENFEDDICLLGIEIRRLIPASFSRPKS